MRLMIENVNRYIFKSKLIGSYYDKSMKGCSRSCGDKPTDSDADETPILISRCRCVAA